MEPTVRTPTDCRHHWLLGQPLDGQVLGVCRNCNAERAFPSFLEDADRLDAIRELQQTSSDLAATAAGGARPSPVDLLVDSGS
jgi:hypothetical protein